MKTRLSIFFAAVILAVSFNSVSFAETIYFKNGKVLKEKIVERGSYYIVTMTGNIPHKYYDDQIDHIEEDEPQETIMVTNIDTTQFPDISQKKVKLIIKLLEASGVRRAMEQNMEQVVAQAPQERREEFEQMFVIDEIIEHLIPVYSKYYSEEELGEIISFYESPAGQKVLEATPQIMKESVDVSIQYFTEKGSL